MNRKGIILAGGTGSRLYPVTVGVSKQLLPVYDKPMIYYPLSVLMLAGIREIAIITTPNDQEQFKTVLGSGEQWGLKFTYLAQPKPEGLAQAYSIAESFLDGGSSAMILGDNIFYGGNLGPMLLEACGHTENGTIFGYRVADPKRYGILDLGEDGDVRAVVEKPDVPASNYAVTGLYFLDSSASQRVKSLKPSERGELEITSLLESYIAESRLNVKLMGRGYAWLDTGTFSSLIEAANFVRTVQHRQGLQVGCPEEIAFNMNWIESHQLEMLALKYHKTSYGEYLLSLCR